MDAEPAVLLERENERATLTALLDRARSGRGGLALVVGPAGIGKTTLLREVGDGARERGLRVLHARGGVLEQDVAYGVVRRLIERPLLAAVPEKRDQLLAGPAAAAARLFALTDAAADAGPLHDPTPELLHGLGWLFGNLAADGPLLVRLDDAHWADVASLRALAHLALRLDDLPIALVLGARDLEPGPAQPVLRELEGGSGTLNVRPRPLTREAVGRLVSGAFGGTAVPEALVGACADATGGNPFFVTELGAELAGSHASPEQVDVAGIAHTGPAGVRRSLLLRLGHLGAPARQLAQAVAVLGGESELRHAAAVAELSVDEAGAAADVLTAAGIFDETGRPRLIHPLVRAAIVDDTPPSLRASAHRRAFAALVADGVADDALLPHALATTPAGEPDVVELLRRTADRALRSGAPDVAVTHLRRALAEPPEAAERPAVLAQLGRAEVRVGAFAEGIGHLDRALTTILDPLRRADVYRDRAFAAFAAEGMGVARSTVHDAVVELTRRGASDQALQLEADLALLAWLSGMPHGLDLRRHGPLAGNTRAERTVLALLAQDEQAAGAPAATVIELSERALAGGRLIAEDTSEALHWYMATYALLICEAHAAARTTIDTALRDGQRRGSAFARAGALGTRAVLALGEGRPGDAEADARAAARGAIPPVMVPVNAAYVVLSLVDQGDLDGAEAELVATGLEHGPGGPTVLRWIPWARLRLREAQHRTADVLADVAPLREDDEAGRPMRSLAWRALVARTLARGEPDPEAARLAGEQLSWAQGWGRPGALGVALRATALAGPGDDRIGGLTDAVDALSTSDLRTEDARARADLGVALLRSGQRRAGQDALRAGLDVAVGCGARDVARRIADELAIAGAPAARLLFDELTASERRVAELASTGATNREIADELFVTPKTVENHLTRVYAKLGVRSRRALADVV